MDCKKCEEKNLEAVFDGVCCDCLRENSSKQFQIWSADLDSLYNERPNAPVLYDERYNLWSAQAQANTLCDHRNAAWVVDKATGKIVYVASALTLTYQK